MINKIKLLLSFLLFVFPLITNAQSIEHPTIWVTASEKSQILDLVDNYDWAKSIVDQLHQRVDHQVTSHQEDPSAILNTIPLFAKNDHENLERVASPIAVAHNQVLSLASDAGILFYLTEDEKYAQFSADILAAYIDVIAPLTPETTTICGYAFFDPRTTYGPFALAYDFVYNYLNTPGVEVYNKVAQAYISFDNTKAQKAIANMVGNVLQEYAAPDRHGKFISNHPILTAPGALFGILCVDDDVERERLFNVFWETGTAHQNSFKQTILPMFGAQGIWPESLSYSFMPIITMVLNIVDRIKPEMKVTEDYQYIFEGNFLFDNLRYPDKRFVRYGDSKRNNDGTGELYRYTLSIADRKGYAELKQQAMVALSQAYNAAGGYQPLLNPTNVFNNSQALQLLWGIPIPEKVEGNLNFNKSTVIVEHAGVALQRNYVKKNNELYGLCGIIGGAHYVHSHCTGIAIELYGAGYVMGPNAGLPRSVWERKIPLHENYFRLYAGNNTVIVNGTSHGLDKGAWKGMSYLWQNTTVNIAAEPQHLEDPICNEFSFATQFLKDEVNKCDQQRTLSVVRTSDTTGYYFDLFRSKSLGENKFHDYIYHNIGDTTLLNDVNRKPLALKSTDRYLNDIGDPVQSPGWRFFEETKTTELTSNALKVRFDIEADNCYMHLLMPEGIVREYTTALAPPTREARDSYLEKKTQVLAIRQEGEAWSRPYVAIFEPSLHTTSCVQNVAHLTDGENIVGAKVISKVGDAVITDYIISQATADALYVNKNLKLRFKGRFAIVRTQGEKVISLYIGEGQKLVFASHMLNANEDGRAFQSY